MVTSAAKRVFPGQDWEVATPESQGIDSAKLAAALDTLKWVTDAKNHQVTHHDGITQTLVVRHGYMIWHGPAIDERHDVWSCTKSFTSICLGLLVDDGKCSLDTLAADVLPSLREKYPAVTLRQMASFVSGYQGSVEGDSAAYFEPGKPNFALGRHFHYSQETDQLAHLLTIIAGEPLRDLFTRRIAGPIGLDAAAWRWGDWGSIGGRTVCGGSGSFARGMMITARAIARVGWLLVNGGRWNGQTLLSPGYVREMTTPQVPATVPPFDPSAWYVRLPGSYGLNIWLNGVTPDGKRQWPDAPPGVAAIQGNMNNICFIIPEWDVVLVRLGTDGRIDLDRYTEVFAAMRAAIKDV